ncbi:MAG: HNH endonuclease [Bacteroidetes bacterium]|nr:HNH endonuclease [Bacteroidota bacterium]
MSNLNATKNTYPKSHLGIQQNTDTYEADPSRFSMQSALPRAISLPVWVKDKYYVDEFGNIFSLMFGKYKRKEIIKIKPGRDKDGYEYAVLHNGKKIGIFFYIHRLVLLFHVGDPPKGKNQANHKNGIKNDNRLENLEWVSPAENIRHAIALGLINRKKKIRNMPDRKPQKNISRTQIH